MLSASRTHRCLRHRRLANAYLNKFFTEALLDGVQLFPGFMTPPPTLNQTQVSRE